MKNKILATGLCLLVLTLCLVPACGGGDEETAPGGGSPAATTTQPTTSGTTTAPPIQTTGAGDDDQLNELLSKWTGLESVQYDLTVSITGQPSMVGHIWQTSTKQKIQYTMEGATTIMIFNMDDNVMYMYMPDQNMATKMTLDPGQMSQGTGEGDMLEVANHDPNISGTEYIDGKECMVITFSSEGQSIKLWVWVNTGFPIRTEGTTPDGTTTIMEYTNIDFSDIPDSVFEIPEDVQVMEI